MANWLYNDWRQEPSFTARLDRLKLHLEEVSARVAETVSSEGQSIDTRAVLDYLKHLEAKADELQMRVDQATGVRGPAFIRGRA